MKEFILLFRMDIAAVEAGTTPEQMELYMKDWNAWIGGIASQNKLVGVNHLSSTGKLLKPGTDAIEGPHRVNRESVAGYIIITADDLEEAVTIAAACPILLGEATSVEVREIAAQPD